MYYDIFRREGDRMDNTLLSIDIGNIQKSKNRIVSTTGSILKLLLKFFVNLIMCFIILITLVFLVVFVDGKINKIRGNSLSPLISTYVIVSPSMVPTIKVQDAVIVARTKVNNLKKGDIITFKSSDARYEGYTITHRINEVVKTEDGKIMFKTKGDNNDSVDNSLVLAENVYGKVIVKLPYLGFLQKFLLTPIMFFLIFLLPSMTILIYNIVKLFTKIRRKNSKIIRDEDIIIEIIDEDISDSENILINENGNDIEIQII